MHAALVIAGKDIRQRFRDRSAVVLGFLAPLGIAALMSAAFSGADNLNITVALVDHDRGRLAAGFGAIFEDAELGDLVEVREVEDEAEARRLVTDADVGAAAVIPAGFSASVTSPTPKSIQVLTSTNATVAGEVLTAIAESYMAQVNATRLSAVSAPDAGEALDGLRIPVRTTDLGIGARELTTISY